MYLFNILWYFLSHNHDIPNNIQHNFIWSHIKSSFIVQIIYIIRLWINALNNLIIVNAQGLVVKTSTTSQTNWQANLSNLMQGTYVLQVVNSSDNSLVGKGTFVKL
jgi:hypothetical protein